MWHSYTALIFPYWQFRSIKRTHLFLQFYTHFECNLILQSLSFVLFFANGNDYAITITINYAWIPTFFFVCESQNHDNRFYWAAFFCVCNTCMRQQQFNMIGFTSVKRLFARIINYHLVFFSFCVIHFRRRSLTHHTGDEKKRLNHVQMLQLFRIAELILKLAVKFVLFLTLPFYVLLSLTLCRSSSTFTHSYWKLDKSH